MQHVKNVLHFFLENSNVLLTFHLISTYFLKNICKTEADILFMHYGTLKNMIPQREMFLSEIELENK